MDESASSGRREPRRNPSQPVARGDLRVFVSYSRPIFEYQERFLSLVLHYLNESSGVDVIVLGMEAEQNHDPLRRIISSLQQSAGLIALAFKRNLIGEGTQRLVMPDGEVILRPIANEWLTSSYCHIEVSLAFQAGLPLLILQEEDVVPEGVLDRSSTGDAIATIHQNALPTDIEEIASSTIGKRVSAWLEAVRRYSGSAKHLPDADVPPPALGSSAP